MFMRVNSKCAHQARPPWTVWETARRSSRLIHVGTNRFAYSLTTRFVGVFSEREHACGRARIRAGRDVPRRQGSNGPILNRSAQSANERVLLRQTQPFHAIARASAKTQARHLKYFSRGSQ
jgi:hypothetical protein